MSSLDEMRVSCFQHGAAVAPDWSAAPAPAVLDSWSRASTRSWAVRRLIVRSQHALIGMRLEEASKITGQLARLVENLDDSRRDRYAATLLVLKASLFAAGDHLEAARSCLKAASPSRLSDATVATLLRYLDWSRGDCHGNETPDTLDYLDPPLGWRIVIRIFGLCVSAALAFERLHLTVAASLAAEALQLARNRYGNHSPLGALPATLLAQVAYEQGRLEDADALLRPLVAVIRTSGTAACIARATVLRARLSLHRGQLRAALAILREAEALGRARGWPRLATVAAAEYGRVLSVVRIDGGRGLETHAPRASESTRRAAAGTPGPQRSEPRSLKAIEAGLRHACKAAAGGRSGEGCELVGQCLRVGAAHGLRMVFLDAGPLSLPLLKRLYESLAVTDPQLFDLRPYIATLLRFRVSMISAEAEPSTYRSLSRRETGILQMIARGFSNKRIAQALGITPETVKSHAKSIFAKLDSRTRAQAAARAESIGLL